MSLRAVITGLVILMPPAAQSLNLEFPATATLVTERNSPNDSRFLPTEPYGDGPMAGITAEGAIQQRSWRVGGSGLTTLQILAPLRDQLLAEGYTPIFECEAKICGGFDFRYLINVLPEPDMHVNLGDYRYFSAKKADGDKPDYVTLVVSRSASAGFVQLTRIGEPEPIAVLNASTKTPDPQMPLTPTGPIKEQLESLGYATLNDLYFKTGSSQLGDEEFGSLKDLATYLISHPNRQVVLVGHTDAEGSLANNIALSRKRATAVVARLVGRYGVPDAQVSADGVGYLAPRASNLTDEGRTQNRRVEVILTSTR